MSAAKYAGLPDIDTAQDVYETPDTYNTTHQDDHTSDEDAAGPQRAGTRSRGVTGGHLASNEELDASPLMATEAASKKFRDAEKKRKHRPRLVYTYPPSPTSDTEDTPARPPPLSQRLHDLQHEIAALESELSDPSSLLLHGDNGEMVDPGVLMKGLLDVRSRLEKVTKSQDGRGKLVERILKPGVPNPTPHPAPIMADKPIGEEHGPIDLAEIDKRVAYLEGVVGSTGTTLDETSPLPPPLLPLISRLNNQLTVLTQPRHIDSISRRLKLLLSDLERVSSAHAASQNRRLPQGQTAPLPSPLQESIQPVLARLAPSLPHIPHILARLRTLSALHNSAASFEETLKDMEEEQKRVRGALQELEKTVQTVEVSLGENEKVISSNVSGLEERVEALGRRLTELGK